MPGQPIPDRPTGSRLPALLRPYENRLNRAALSAFSWCVVAWSSFGSSTGSLLSRGRLRIGRSAFTVGAAVGVFLAAGRVLGGHVSQTGSGRAGTGADSLGLECPRDLGSEGCVRWDPAGVAWPFAWISSLRATMTFSLLQVGGHRDATKTGGIGCKRPVKISERNTCQVRAGES
jgi:hypothetical protein